MQVLIVDDEPAIRQVLASTLQKAGHGAEPVGSGAEALERLARGDIDVVISDITMPGMNGIEMVRQARARGSETVFLMMTAYASVDTAIEAIKAGAYDYLTKPLRKEDVLLRLDRIAGMIGLREQNRTLRNLVRESEPTQCALNSQAMMVIDRLVRKVAPTDYTVMITGESGTGKGVTAQQIHRLSTRSEALMIPVNCGSIPENLMESEFFGHVKGAFTGADRIKKGLFAEADQGTLFLDEIGELPLQLQVKLLHVLEEKQVRPVGAERFRKVDVRIIAATNRNLQEMVSAGTFREDLYFRLNVFSIHITPLRERREDLPALIRYYLDRNDRRAGRSCGFRLDPDAEAALLAYDWPGNVRELENTLERALILAEDGVIALVDLPASVAASAMARTSAALPAGQTLREKIRAFEIQAILDAIREAEGDRRLAAQRLGIGLSSLYRKLELASGFV